MANHRCPHCQTPIRGLQVFKARAAGSMGQKEYRCPACQTRLVLLPNRWQVSGLLVAIATILLRLVVQRTEFPLLWMGLALCTLAGFFCAAMGMLYFPRYGLAP